MQKLMFLAAAGLILAGCATPRTASPGAVENNDPYENSNRAVFAFNLKLDSWTLKPTARRYSEHVPEEVRDAIRNLEENLDRPVVFANDLLQGEGKRAGESAGRFLLNSTFGLAGLLDVASRVGIATHDEDFGQTLAVWGVGEGPYLMLPLLGPSSPRDAAGSLGDVALDPTVYISIKHHTYWIAGRQYLRLVDARARNLDVLEGIERDSLDFYATSRSLYRQHRQSEIRNGKPPVDDESGAMNLP
jgi:phospholipid-binding lipoprotein MlaA